MNVKVTLQLAEPLAQDRKLFKNGISGINLWVEEIFGGGGEHLGTEDLEHKGETVQLRLGLEPMFF